MGHLVNEVIIGERLGFLLKQKAIAFKQIIELVPGDEIFYIADIDGEIMRGISQWPIIAYNPKTVLDYVVAKYRKYNTIIGITTNPDLHPSKSITLVKSF